MEVLNELKPGLDEKLYERAMIIELKRGGHTVSVQTSFPVFYRGELIGNLIPDLIVDEAVIVDPKVVSCFTETHIAQMIGYLNKTRLDLALLLNFKNARLEWKRVLRPQEGAEVIRHIPRTTPEYNLRTGLYALEKLIDLSYGHAYDVVIFDRCIFDTYGWMMYWESKGKIPKAECELFQQFFLSRFWVDRVIASYVMVCDAEEAMRRELRIALSDKMGETTNPDTITSLVARYRTMCKDLGAQFPQLQLIETTTMQEQEMVSYIATTTLETILRKVREQKK